MLPGDEISITLDISNNTGYPIYDIRSISFMPAALSDVEVTGTRITVLGTPGYNSSQLEFYIDDLRPGEVTFVTITATIDPNSPIGNLMAFRTQATSSTGTSNVEISTIVVGRPYDQLINQLSVSITGPAEYIEAGQEIRYTITITNTDSFSIRSIRVVHALDHFALDVIAMEWSRGVLLSAQSPFDFFILDLEAGEPVDVTITATVSPLLSAGSSTTVTSLASLPFNPYFVEGAATFYAPPCDLITNPDYIDLYISMTPSVDAALAGEEIVYTIVIENRSHGSVDGLDLHILISGLLTDKVLGSLPDGFVYFDNNRNPSTHINTGMPALRAGQS